MKNMRQTIIILIGVSVAIMAVIAYAVMFQLENDNNYDIPIQQSSSPPPSDFNNKEEEDYFYIQDYKLEKLPTFCAQDFTDLNMPSVNEIVTEKMQQSIQKWEDKLVRYTGNSGWNFEFKVMSLNDNNESTKIDCDATFVFKPIPSEGQEETRGETFPSGNFSEVVIFYLDPIDIKKIDPDIDFIITHEIGHVLGLDHPIFDDGPFIMDEENEIPVARSIMVSPENYYNLPENMRYEITDYDVRSVVNLYKDLI